MAGMAIKESTQAAALAVLERPAARQHRLEGAAHLETCEKGAAEVLHQQSLPAIRQHTSCRREQFHKSRCRSINADHLESSVMTSQLMGQQNAHRIPAVPFLKAP